MTLTARRVTVASRLDDISAHLEPGRIIAICGPNGAGKSTLLAVLAGLLPCDRGEVLLEGRPLAKMTARERARRIGYLPQAGKVEWDIDVRSLVALGRMPHGDRESAPVERAIAALDLGALADRPVSRLSGGERARALLARVLAGEPDWILADEPLASLDLGHQLALLAHLRRAAERAAGVVLVLHDLALAMNHADRVVVLDRGVLLADGPAELALSSDVIDRVWHIRSQWLGQPGTQALAML